MGHHRGTYAYEKMEAEDPEERRHRRAQFLIYKVLESADAEARRSSRPSLLGLRFCKLRVKIGKKLKRSRKKMFLLISTARVAIYRRIKKQLKKLESLPHLSFM